jgi:hypothetical protein
MDDVSLSHHDLRDLTSLGTGAMALPLVQQKCNARVREGASTTRAVDGCADALTRPQRVEISGRTTRSGFWPVSTPRRSTGPAAP